MTKKIGFVPTMLAAFATTTIILTVPQIAHADAPFEVVRAGDNAMSCPALAAEINALGQPQTAATEAKPKKKGGLGFLKVLGSAVPVLGSLGGGMGGALLSSAAGAAQTAAMQGQADDQMTRARDLARDAMNGGTPAQQRKDRLTAIFDQKGC